MLHVFFTQKVLVTIVFFNRFVLSVFLILSHVRSFPDDELIYAPIVASHVRLPSPVLNNANGARWWHG